MLFWVTCKLYIGIKDEKAATSEDVKKNYLSLIKQYHADNHHFEGEKAQEYEEITKIIVAAY
jgi:curved DNA-binding protein CbpA